MLWYFPYWNSFWLVYDEGYNLMKAMLVERGYHLYSQIWSDQAPLFTYILAGIFRLNGYSVYLSRVFVLFVSAILVWAVVQYTRLTWGNLPALIAAVLLVLLPDFLVVSTAVLVGQPSITLAMLSMLALGMWHSRHRHVYLWLSAILLSLSLLAKLFTAFLVPVFLMGLLAEAYFLDAGSLGRKKNWKQVFKPALVWSLVLAGCSIGLGLLLVNPSRAAQLFQPHWAAAQATEYPTNVEFLSINDFLAPAWPVILGAGLGAGLAVKRRRWLAAYPLGWMASAYLSLLVTRPVWWHHRMLVMIPAAILCAGAFGESMSLLVRGIQSRNLRRNSWQFMLIGLICLVLVVVVRAPDVAGYLRSAGASNSAERNPAEEKFMRKIQQFAPQTVWMVTDMPMFAFRAGLLTPPDLAVISWKRFAAGDLTEMQILQDIQTLRPEQVLFGRFNLPLVDQYLEENYRVVIQRNTMKLYIRSDLDKGSGG